ncbi:MAG: restriction endonuclease [Myxococcales bacterium]|nr:restriction endonuclease [Myxococcales bacterium]
MATCRCTRVELFETLSEFAGYKAGLALTRAELRAHLPDAVELEGEDRAVLRVRHERLDELVRNLLFQLGTLSKPPGESSPMNILLQWQHDPDKADLVGTLMESLWSTTRRHAEASAKKGGILNAGPVDITPMAEAMAARHGMDGLELFTEFQAVLEEDMHGSMISGFRRVEWINREQLASLFCCEDVEPAHGTYLDQRFIDYLERHHSALDGMNWRKFEGLAGEYFAREGYSVEMGRGRADGGVDLRVWKDPDAHGTAPPTILVQCKRQKAKVGKVVVKALWADVDAEGAETGLVVTTSALEPGAQKVCVARGYAIQAAERPTLISWLHALRTPGSGVFAAR